MVRDSEGLYSSIPRGETRIKVFTVAFEDKVGYIPEKAESKEGWMYPISREQEICGYLAELNHFLTERSLAKPKRMAAS